MRQAVTMSDVARAAQVDVSTVSRALSGRGDLPAATRARIQRIARDLGYVRGASPYGRPVSTDPRIIELVLGGFGDPWADEVTAGARRSAAAFGYDLVLTLERDHPSEDWPSRVAARRSTGVILGNIMPTSRQLAQLQGLSVPLVLLDPTSDPHGQLVSIGTTDWQGGYDAGAHLAAAGLRAFVVVAGDPPLRFGRAREEGFRQAIGDLVRDGEIHTVPGAWLESDLSGELAPVLDRLPPPVGIFCCNDAMAFGVYRAAVVLGLVIPDDLQVVGFDDVTKAASMAPTLTTLRQPLREMAYRAIELVQQLRAGQAVPTDRIELPTELIVRGSTRVLTST